MAAPHRKKKKSSHALAAVLLTILAVILIGAIVFLSQRLAGKPAGTAAETAVSGDTGSDGSGVLSFSESTAPKEAESVSSEMESSRDTVELTEAQIHTGDLILVNASLPYDFEANEDEIDLVTIKDAQTIAYPVDRGDFQLSSRIMPYLDQLIKACNDAMGNSYTSISSAWRSLEYQQNVYQEAAETNGEDYAKQYVAEPGYSEHHTGLAVDFGITYDSGALGSFSESENAEWMKEHAWEYGFIRRYAEDKVSITGISNEAWHFRYVGKPHALYMYQNNLALEEYLDFLRSSTSAESPLEISTDSGTYSVYYTAEHEIEKPGHEYTVSGDNEGGYIITVSAS
jgi:D-alanyl-D-alanine carboxypeptidase